MESILINILCCIFLFEERADVEGILVRGFLWTYYIWTVKYMYLFDIFLSDKKINIKQREYLFETELYSYGHGIGKLFRSLLAMFGALLGIVVIWIVYVLATILIILIVTLVATINICRARVDLSKSAILRALDGIHEDFFKALDSTKEIYGEFKKQIR